MSVFYMFISKNEKWTKVFEFLMVNEWKKLADIKRLNHFQNKTFIYRGNECLKLQDIINQLKQEYPLATILQFNNPIDEEKRLGEAQCRATFHDSLNTQNLLMNCLIIVFRQSFM